YSDVSSESTVKITTKFGDCAFKTFEISYYLCVPKIANLLSHLPLMSISIEISSGKVKMY
ncbi:MAG: hypothetical protein WB511_09335, partial [Nitrososphaeraceae archaeon]